MKCKYCGKEYVKNEAEGLQYLPEFLRKHVEYIPACDCLEKLKEKELDEIRKKREEESVMNRVKKFKDISVMNKKFFKSTFEVANMNERYMKLAFRYARSFLKKDMRLGILFYGGVGVGKTFASSCIANYLMKKGKSVLLINFGLYFNKLSKEWGEAETKILQEVERCDLLIIDDFGVEKSLNDNSWRGEKIYNLIDTRYRCEKPMIITTNLEFDEREEKCEIGKKFSIGGKNRIRDRIIDMCYPVKVEGKSHRGIDEKEFFKEIE